MNIHTPSLVIHYAPHLYFCCTLGLLLYAGTYLFSLLCGVMLQLMICSGRALQLVPSGLCQCHAGYKGKLACSWLQQCTWAENWPQYDSCLEEVIATYWIRWRSIRDSVNTPSPPMFEAISMQPLAVCAVCAGQTAGGGGGGLTR